MAQYVYIDNYSNLGSMGISNHVFYQIAQTATNNVKGATISANKLLMFFLQKPLSIRISKGLVTVKLEVSLSKEANINDVCLKIQEEVATALSSMTELVPFKINVKVAEII
jgi:uncharacterized alkaline shock family protein YloU